MRTSWFIPPTEVGVAPPQPEGQGHGSCGAIWLHPHKAESYFLEPASAVRIWASRRIGHVPVAVGLRLTASFGG